LAPLLKRLGRKSGYGSWFDKLTMTPYVTLSPALRGIERRMTNYDTVSFLKRLFSIPPLFERGNSLHPPSFRKRGLGGVHFSSNIKE